MLSDQAIKTIQVLLEVYRISQEDLQTEVMSKIREIIKSL